MTTYERNDHFFYLEFKDLENQSGKTLQTASKSLQKYPKYSLLRGPLNPPPMLSINFSLVTKDHSLKISDSSND